MTDASVKTTVTGGQIQGVAGAGTVVIENFTIYNRSVEEPTATDAAGEPIAPCPYPGLAYFGPVDADLFFGRDRAITRLVEEVGRQSLTALIGASGSGKSSVVLAGLAPRLYGAGGWLFSHFRIGTELDSNSFLALARALVSFYVASDSDTARLRNTNELAADLETGKLTLRNVFAECRKRHPGKRILLIADQFEEVFTLIDEAVRQRFIDVLLAGFPDPAPGSSPEISLTLTLRADFYGHALRHRSLADALQGHVENLGPMNREELQAAVRRPAEIAKVSFEGGLVETLLDEVENKPGSLPLLQFALREMWGRQEKRRITRKSYDDIGGVERALAQRAETIFVAMTENGTNPQMAEDFRRLFTRLVALGEGQEDTRRVVDRRELGESVWSLAQRLAGEDNRLVVTNAPAFSRETAEVVHEALIRHWPKLVDWINRDRAFQSWLRQIKSNVELWSGDRTDEGPLLRGGMLAQASDWFARRADDLSPVERSYIEASLTLRQREEDQKEAARQAEIGRQQELAEAAIKLASEQQRRTKLAVVGGIVALLLAAFGGWEALLARKQTNEAQLQKNRAVSLLARQATDRGDATTGMLAVLAVMTPRPHMAVAAMALLDAWLRNREVAALIGHTGSVTSAAFSPDGKRVVTASWDKTARVWDLSGPAPVATVLSGHTEQVTSAAFSPDGKRVVTASADMTARVWDLSGPAPAATVLSGHTGSVYSAAFSPDGRRVVTASDDKTARVWDLSGPVPAATVLSGHTDWVKSAAFSPDGKHVVTASADSTVIIYPVPPDEELMILARRAVTRCLTTNQREDLGLVPEHTDRNCPTDADRNCIRSPPCPSWNTLPTQLISPYSK